MSMNVLAEEEGMSQFVTERTVDADGKPVPRVMVASSRGSETSAPNVLRTVYLPNE